VEGVRAVPNPLCHFELMSSDPVKSRAFYSSVFDWQFDNDSMPGYTLINAGAEPSGGLFQEPDGTPGPCLNVYFQTDDVDDTLHKAVEAGATVLVPKTQIPNVGEFAIFTDPDGIAVGLLKPSAG
jgi:hypothetical protein